MATRNYKITIAYDGQAYFGWQRHGDKPTLQGALEDTLDKLYGGTPVVHGSGRTDRGAHATGQVVSVNLPEGLEPERAVADLNDALPEDMEAISVEPVAEDFHARESATGKRYRYELYCGEELPEELAGRVWHVRLGLNTDDMRAACKVFEGEHDFASFAKKPNFKQKSTVRTIRNITLEEDGPSIWITMEADGFLYKMVRNLVRAIVKVGEGRQSPQELKRVLEKKDRKAAPGTAPASGLYLDAVFYSGES